MVRNLKALLVASCLSATLLPAVGQAQPADAPARVTQQPARIGRADLERARKLLSDARNELEPRQWALLDAKLADAEQAWDRFAQLSRDGGRAAEVARGAEGLAQASRTPEGEGVRALPRAGPLLLFLGLLWPARTAGPAYDELPPWLAAQQVLALT
jgi:hypothetical protein